MQRFIPRSPMRAAKAPGGSAAKTNSTSSSTNNAAAAARNHRTATAATVQSMFDKRSPDGQRPTTSTSNKQTKQTQTQPTVARPPTPQTQIVVAGNKRLTRRSFSPVNHVAQSSISPIPPIQPAHPATGASSSSSKQKLLSDKPANVWQRLSGFRTSPSAFDAMRKKKPESNFRLIIENPDGTKHTENMRLNMPTPRPKWQAPASTPKHLQPSGENAVAELLNVSGGPNVSLNSSSLLNVSSPNTSAALNVSAEGRNPHLDDNISVETVLDAVGYGKYADVFERQQIEVEQMIAMDKADLANICHIPPVDAAKLAEKLRRL